MVMEQVCCHCAQQSHQRGGCDKILEERAMLLEMWEKKNGNISRDVIFRLESGFGGEVEDATNFSREEKMIGNFESEASGGNGVNMMQVGV